MALKATEVRVNFEGGSVPGSFYDLVYSHGMRISESWVYNWGDDTAVIVETNHVTNAEVILAASKKGVIAR